MYADEGWTYDYSNNYEGTYIVLHHMERLQGKVDYMTWTPSAFFRDKITVQPGEQFAYGTIFKNAEDDPRLPLYSILLNTICSLFLDTYSKWFGLGLNLLLFIFIQISLYLLSQQISGDRRFSLAVIAYYGFTAAALSTFLYIMHYILCSLCVTLFAYLSVRILKKDEISVKDLVFIALATVMGVMSEYLFYLFAFPMACFICFHFLTKKRFKDLIKYGAVQLAAAVTPLIVLRDLVAKQIEWAKSTGTVGGDIKATAPASILNLVPVVLNDFLGIPVDASDFLWIPKPAALVFFCAALITAIGIWEVKRIVTRRRHLYGVCMAATVFWTVSLITAPAWNQLVNRVLFGIYPVTALLICVFLKWLFSRNINRSQRYLFYAVIVVAVVCSHIFSLNLWTGRSNTYYEVMSKSSRDASIIHLNHAVDIDTRAYYGWKLDMPDQYHFWLSAANIYQTNNAYIEDLGSVALSAPEPERDLILVIESSVDTDDVHETLHAAGYESELLGKEMPANFNVFTYTVYKLNR